MAAGEILALGTPQEIKAHRPRGSNDRSGREETPAATLEEAFLALVAGRPEGRAAA